MTEASNLQTMFKEYKIKIKEEARKTAKVAISKMDRKISDLNKEITGIMSNASLTEEEKKVNSATALEIINQIEKSRHNSIRLQTAARNKLEGETVSKY